MGKNRYAVRSILGLVLIIFFMSGCEKDVQKAEESTKYVKIYKISDGATSTRLVFNGEVKEKSKVDVSFRVGGPLVRLSVKEGDYVKKGELIAAIDNRDYKIQLESSKARYDQVKSEFERYDQLFSKEKIPANTYEKIKSQYLLVKSSYENAQHQYDDTQLASPMSGYVFKKHVENFQTVGPGQPIISIIDNSTLEVIVHVPENQLASINSNKEFLLNVTSADLEQVPVTLINIAEKAGDHGLYEVKFNLINKNEMAVYPGMTAEISMYSAKGGDGISIPSNSVFRNNNDTYVWLYDESKGTVQKQKVTIASLQSNGKVGISGGLSVGESIVEAGVHYLQENEKVQPVAEASKTNVGGLL